jgi:hypothetical protein
MSASHVLLLGPKREFVFITIIEYFFLSTIISLVLSDAPLLLCRRIKVVNTFREGRRIMAHHTSHNYDEDSDNSSENSFNELANAALAVGYAMSMMMAPAPPTFKHVLVPDLTGRQWVNNVLSIPNRCFINFRMQPENFYKLHHILTNYYGLEPTRDISTEEMLGLFLWVIGTKQSMRQMHERIRRGLGTCSKVMQHVLNAMMPFADVVLRPMDSSYAELPEELAEYSPLFDGCIGALDGTLIEVSVPKRVQADFTNRHGWRSQNVICVCDFNMMFTYVGVGTEGSAHDMRVLKQRALMDSKFPRPPKGLFAKIKTLMHVHLVVAAG